MSIILSKRNLDGARNQRGACFPMVVPAPHQSLERQLDLWRTGIGYRNERNDINGAGCLIGNSGIQGTTLALYVNDGRNA